MHVGLRWLVGISTFFSEATDNPLLHSPNGQPMAVHGHFKRVHYSHQAVCILQWRYNGRDGVSNHQPHHCLLSRLFRRTLKKTRKLRVTYLCLGNSPASPVFAQSFLETQIKGNIKAPLHCPLWGESTGDRWIPLTKGQWRENVSIWWRHHDILTCSYKTRRRMCSPQWYSPAGVR